MKINDIPEALCQKLRIKIISSLIQSSKTFNELITITEASRGNLSVQLSKLEEWHYLSSHKYIKGKKTETTYSITEFGTQQFESYVLLLQSVLFDSTE